MCRYRMQLVYLRICAYNTHCRTRIHTKLHQRASVTMSMHELEAQAEGSLQTSCSSLQRSGASLISVRSFMSRALRHSGAGSVCSGIRTEPLKASTLSSGCPRAWREGTGEQSFALARLGGASASGLQGYRATEGSSALLSRTPPASASVSVRRVSVCEPISQWCCEPIQSVRRRVRTSTPITLPAASALWLRGWGRVILLAMCDFLCS